MSSSPKQRVSISLPSPVSVSPDTVQCLINEFFNYYSDARQVEETFWRMFSSSISNAECPTDSTENANQAFLYRMVLDLVRELEKYRQDTTLDLPQN